MAAAIELAEHAGMAEACRALGVARASVYRRRRGPAIAPRARPTPPRALSLAEREGVLAVLHELRFADRAPAEVYATLLDEGRFLCSVRTMYRVLAERSEVRERRRQLRHPAYAKPELLATAPNQVWTWDITKLRGPVKWSYFHLYVLLDVFSRYVVGWMVAQRESAELGARLIRGACQGQGVRDGELTIHADRGAAMVSGTVAQLLATLGVERSHSRPHVSNDNPYSESLFRTVKYGPEFPERFGALEHALSFGRRFFPWYNAEHRHSGIGMLTPETVHYGRAARVYARRQEVLLEAFAAHPERFVRNLPAPPDLPGPAWINRPSGLAEVHGTHSSAFGTTPIRPEDGLAEAVLGTGPLLLTH